MRSRQDEGSFRFRTGVELINVTASVSDGSGRFVRGLAKEDFTVYEDGQRQEVTHFSSERVPVSLGIVLDTSGSMDGEKMQAAKAALNRFLYDLLDPEDEIFLYTFDDDTRLVQGWTSDRPALSRAVNRLRTDGATAMYDADCGSGAARGVRPSPEKGDHPHFRRKRYVEQYDRSSI